MIKFIIGAVAAGLLAIGCGGGMTAESCFNKNTNRPVGEGGCQGMSDPAAQDACLSYWYDSCTMEYGS